MGVSNGIDKAAAFDGRQGTTALEFRVVLKGSDGFPPHDDECTLAYELRLRESKRLIEKDLSDICYGDAVSVGVYRLIPTGKYNITFTAESDSGTKSVSSYDFDIVRVRRL